MDRRLLFDSKQLDITIRRLCHQLIENHGDFHATVILGLQPRGIYLAERVRNVLMNEIGVSVPLGYLDITFHRDDFRRRDEPLRANATHIPFIIENKKVVLVDDVLFTGRTVRAAMDAMNAYGRPQKVEFLVLIDRMYSRDIPVEATFTGKKVNTIKSQRILVELKEQGMDEDSIWIMDKIDK